MSSRVRGARLLARPVALLVLVGALSAVAAPGEAVRTTFGNTDGVSIVDAIAQAQNNDITIVDNAEAGDYPSTINVTTSGKVVDVNVRLNNVDHPVPDDVDIMLVGPTGAQATIMSDAGGSVALTDVDVVLDDQAPTALPDSTEIESVVPYRPRNYDGTDDFPSPAPVDTGGSALSVFNGTDPKGAWQLFVVDDTAGQGGLIAGWALDISVESTPEPSTIGVSGLSPYVTDVDVTLGGLTHGFSSDVDMLLVGPHGQYATILSDVGGSGSATAVDLVLDDSAPTGLPAAANLTSGTFKPTNNGSTDPFPGPAPTTSGASALSAFVGTDPNGTWSLYVVDDAHGDAGSLDSWSLDIETDDTPPFGTAAINGGKAVTTSRTVKVDLAASDPGPASSGVAGVRLSNDGLTFSAPVAYAASTTWTLSPGDGVKTVWVTYVDAAGFESSPFTDTILLDTTAPRAVQTKPANHAKGVAVSGRVQVVASEQLKGSTITSTTVVLRSASGKVAAKLTYAATTRTISIVPRTALRHHTTYTLTVDGVRDRHGVRWDQKPKAGIQPLRLSFTTA